MLVYNDEKVAAGFRSTGIDGLLDPKWKGQIGFAPTNASFQAFVTGLRVSRGEDGARQEPRGVRGQRSRRRSKATAAHGGCRQRPGHGRSDQPLLPAPDWPQEKGAENSAVQIHYFQAGDPGAPVNIAGAGVLATTDQPEQAQQFVAALLSPESQAYFADETSEYPAVPGVETKDDLRPLTEIGTSDIASRRKPASPRADPAALLQELGFI